MKRIAILTGSILALLICLPAPATAQPGTFGLGIIVGEPTGLDAKYYLNRTFGFTGAVAWSLSGNNNLHLQLDYLYHKYDVFDVSKGELPFFVGIGGRIVFRENQSDTFGIRIPVGLLYNFAGLPIDIFGELVPILDLTPDTEFDFEAAIGGRFYF